MNNNQLLSVYQSLSVSIEFDRFKNIMEKYETLMEMLAEKQVHEQTHYTGRDLNFLESLADKICESTIELKDLYQLEQIVFQFL